jgi:hypothetical protein
MKDTFSRRWTIVFFLTMALFLAAHAPAQEAPKAVSLNAPVTGTISSTGKVDWYTLTTDVVGDLTVTQTEWPPFIETRIAIFGPNSQALQQNNPLYCAAPGTYYFKVWSANQGSSKVPYKFNVSLKKAITGNDIDGGRNSASGAVPITLGTAVTDTIAPSKATAGKQDVDWFSLTTNAVGDLTVTQTEWPPYIETRIAIFGPNNPSLQLNNPALKAAPGTYYIKVWSANEGSSIIPYKFGVNYKGVTATPTQTGTVSGRVADEKTNAPLPGARVSVAGTGEVTTNSNGDYTIGNVPAGRATVAVSCTGYEPQSKPVDVGAGATANVGFGLAKGAGIVPPGSMTLQAEKRQVRPGERVVIPVWLYGAQGIANLNFNVLYDARVAAAGGSIAKGNMLGNSLFEANPGESGVIRVGFAQNNDLSGTGIIAEIPFTAAGQPGDRTALRLVITATGSAGGGKPAVKAVDGEILILAQGTGIRGDSDGDGQLTARDAGNALKMSVRLIPVNMNLDMDNDGQVTSSDARMILQKAVGK